MDRGAMILGTGVGTLSVVCLVVGVGYPAPPALRVVLICLGAALLASTLWGIFEWLEILDRRRYFFDPGGGPDGGERVPRSSSDNVYQFPKRAA